MQRVLLAASLVLALWTNLSQAGPVFVSVKESMESASAGAVNGQLTTPLWSDSRITGLTTWRGTTAAGRTAYFTTDPVAGNTSWKASAESITAPPAGDFFFGFRSEFYTHNAPARRARFMADATTVIRAEATVFTNEITALWTLEPGSISQNFIMDRVMLGGPCVLNSYGSSPFECDDVGLLPGDPMPILQALGYMPCSICIPDFMPLSFQTAAPQGFEIGDYAPTPFGSWVRLIFERDGAGVIRIYADYLNGEGEFLLRELQGYTPATIVDSMGVNGSFLVTGAPYYMDDVLVSGLLSICDGDADGDGDVDFNDLNITISQYSTQGPGLGGDFNGDLRVDFTDLNILLGRFNQPCE